MWFVDTLLKKLITHRERSMVMSVHKEDEKKVNRSRSWTDSQEIYYLLDTLKLNYSTVAGNMTVENLSKESIDCLISGELPIADKIKETQFNCVTLSVCGVNWQASGDMKRCKAIDSAATIRINNDCHFQTQAHFKHVDLVLDHKLDELTGYFSSRGTDVVYNLSIKQFVRFLQQQNTKFKAKFDQKPAVTSRNFKPLFSPFETKKIEDLISLGHP